MMYGPYSSLKDLYGARHEPENLRPIAEAYWHAILLFAVIGMAGVVLLGLWEFSAVTSKIQSSLSNSNTPQGNALDRSQLEKTLNEFATRRAEFELASKGSHPIDDPSGAR